jgi:hypothetical protein
VLPDFVLTVAVDGVPRRFAACDVPTYIYFYEYPDDFPGTACFLQKDDAGRKEIIDQQERWTTRLLTRVILSPALTPELVHRLGKVREHLGVAYQTAIGLPPIPGVDIPPAELLPSPWVGARPWEQEIMRARIWVPGPNLREKIRLMSTKMRRPHLEAWNLPISEWVLTWRIAVEDEQKRRAGEPAAVARASSSSLINLIGMADG